MVHFINVDLKKRYDLGAIRTANKIYWLSNRSGLYERRSELDDRVFLDSNIKRITGRGRRVGLDINLRRRWDRMYQIFVFPVNSNTTKEIRKVANFGQEI